MTDTPVRWQRSFIALAPDDATRDAMLSIPLQPALRPMLRADLHLTLAFLGDLSVEQRNALQAELPDRPMALPPFAFTGIESWPTAARPNVVVATFEMVPQLQSLLDQINDILRDLKFTVERQRFQPHITLARGGRKKTVAGPVPAAREPVSSHARFNGLGLYARTPTGSEVRYQSLWYRTM